MGWDDYHLNDPAFCTPLPVMRGLVSALCERREAVDAEFHESCTSCGSSAVIGNRLAHILTGEWYDNAEPQGIPFREIKKEYAFDEIRGFFRRLPFMHIFDALLVQTMEEYNARRFTDSTGNTVYETLEHLASALSEPLIVPEKLQPLIVPMLVPTIAPISLIVPAASMLPVTVRSFTVPPS